MFAKFLDLFDFTIKRMKTKIIYTVVFTKKAIQQSGIDRLYLGSYGQYYGQHS